MAELVDRPVRVPVPGGKTIDAYVGRASTGTLDVRGGQAVVTRAGERVRYSAPKPDGAEYVAICLPAFGPDIAHREPE